MDTSPIFCVAKHPVRLRDTAGEEGEGNPPFITDLIISFYCFCFNPLALWALPLYSLTETQGERRANSITFASGLFNPSVLTDTSPIFYDAKHPVRLRGTAGERVRCISLSLLLRFYMPHPVMLRGTAREVFGSGLFFFFLGYSRNKNRCI